tara:strand:- start:1510 stop:1974 length:465 start_codon:yes stop_codon:yes gene_type:complete
MNAKEIIKNKFWIVQDGSKNVGTISFNEEQYMLSDATGSRFFSDTVELEDVLKSPVSWQELAITESKPVKEVHTYPTSTFPYNSMYDVKRKLPLFTKSEKSKSLYCAGYYTIKFEKGWVKSFCPKLITVERYDFRGPFKTEIEMRTELSRVNAK